MALGLEYRLKDANNNVFSLNGDAVPFALKETWTQGGSTFSLDTRVVDRTFIPGSKRIGETRLEARTFVLEFEETQVLTDDFRDNLNSLLEFYVKTTKIEDNTSGMDISVVPTTMDIAYLAGSLKKHSENTLTFVALNPFWEDLTADTLTGTATANVIAAIPFNNEGYLETYPVITLVATEATNDIEINILSTDVGIEIADNIFGTPGNLTMEINCLTGKVTINDLDRNASIVPGTGPFPLPVGSDTLNILSNKTITYTIEWRKRYFI